MPIALAPSLTHRDYYWTTWKTVQASKGFAHQYDDDGQVYLIYGYDLPEVIKCTIWKGEVPEGVQSVYSQVQNDSDKADFEASWKASANKAIINTTSVASAPPFGAKSTMINGVLKKFYARNTGIQQDITTGSNDINFTIGYPWVKIIGIECINCEALDTAELRVYDNALGSYSGVPNALLNQFGYSLNMAEGFYGRFSPFDADLYQGMLLKITYVSISDKRIAMNVIMNEVKS